MLLTLSLIVFSVTVWKSRTEKGAEAEHREPWKSSILPSLWCGLQHETKKRHAVLARTSEMEAWIRNAEVRLERKDYLDFEQVKRQEQAMKS